MGASSEEFPLLPVLGLYAAAIAGDGNCLFNALSDQLYGSPEKHDLIRAAVVDYMREHGAYYKQFIDVHPGGGLRRNPKRKNAGAFSTPTYASTPTPAEIDRVFEQHLLNMAKGGVYGDNMEISAFTCAFGVDVKIYQNDFAYMVCSPVGGEERTVCHIAYHLWEHYSSVRNVDGPHHGPPHVLPRTLSPEEEAKQKIKLMEHTPKVPPWQIDLVHSSLPYYLDRASIKRTIEECKGDINRATEKLLEADDRRSPASSAQDSSSVEREPDSDDEALNAPNKKRDRRMSRAANAGLDRTPKPLIIKLNTKNDSLESLVKAISAPVTAVRRNESFKGESDQDTEDDDWRVEPLKDGDTSSGSEYSDSDQKSVQSKNNTDSQHSNTEVAAQTKHIQLGPRRKMISARQLKDIKKQAQKAAAKERRQAAAGSKSVPPSAIATASNVTQGTLSFPTISKGIRTLYI